MKDVIQVHNAPLHSILPATSSRRSRNSESSSVEGSRFFVPKRERNARFTSTQILLSGNYTLTPLNCKRIEWIQLGKNWLGYITPQVRYRFWLITQSSKLSSPISPLSSSHKPGLSAKSMQNILGLHLPTHPVKVFVTKNTLHYFSTTPLICHL